MIITPTEIDIETCVNHMPHIIEEVQQFNAIIASAKNQYKNTLEESDVFNIADRIIRDVNYQIGLFKVDAARFGSESLEELGKNSDTAELRRAQVLLLEELKDAIRKEVNF